MRSTTRNLLAATSVLALALVGCGGGGDESGDAEGAASIESADGSVALTGTDTLQYSATSITSEVGDLSFDLTCEAAAEHNVVIEEAGDELVAECQAGGSGSGDITLEAGSYTYYCSIPGHRSAGMEGTLTVS